MDKQIVFLSGLPRTGSTLLTSILNQHPEIHAEGQSALCFLLAGAKQTCEGYANEGLVRAYRRDFFNDWCRATTQTYYKNVSKRIIVEKARGWTRDGDNLRYQLADKPRIVTLLRPITEIVKSFVRVRQANNYILPEHGLLSESSPLMIAIQNVAWALQQDSDEQLFATYDQLVREPKRFVDQICAFWGIEDHDFQFSNLVNVYPENDEELKTTGMHEIRKTVSKNENDTKISQRLLAAAGELDEALTHDLEQARQLRPKSFLHV